MTGKLILASGSKARAEMLHNAGYDFDIIPANINEQEIIDTQLAKKETFKNIAMILASQKALSIKCENETFIIGSDQLLIFNDTIFSKSENKDEAFKKLKLMQGKKHSLISAVSVIQNNKIIWQECDFADLYMKKMNEKQIYNYLDKAGETALSCVGGYAIEGVGARLFTQINGDYFTIMGMPLLPLINFLDIKGFDL